MLSNSSCCVEELEPLHVPGDVAGVGHDLQSVMGAMRPCLLLEVRFRRRAARPCLLEHFQSELRGRLALGMEVARQRVDLLGARWCRLEEQVAASAKAAAAAGTEIMNWRLVVIFLQLLTQSQIQNAKKQSRH